MKSNKKDSKLGKSINNKKISQEQVSVKEEGQVPLVAVSVNYMTSSIYDLSVIIDILQNKINPILKVVPVPETMLKERTHYEVPLAESIAEMNDIIKQQINKLSELIERVEV